VSEEPLARAVAVACHDLRTPLAAAKGLATMLGRQPELGARERQFAEMIDAAAAEMASLLDQLWLAGRIAGGQFEPHLVDLDSIELVRSEDPRVTVAGTGAVVTIDVETATAALSSLAHAALRLGELDALAWQVDGRRLVLTPLPDHAWDAVAGAAPRDLGALVGRMALEALGARLAREEDGLLVELG
jgi:light-regulated signal transduction histidine kinase (bacteriophytochrome)